MTFSWPLVCVLSIVQRFVSMIFVDVFQCRAFHKINSFKLVQDHDDTMGWIFKTVFVLIFTQAESIRCLKTVEIRFRNQISEELDHQYEYKMTVIIKQRFYIIYFADQRTLCDNICTKNTFEKWHGKKFTKILYVMFKRTFRAGFFLLNFFFKFVRF